MVVSLDFAVSEVTHFAIKSQVGVNRIRHCPWNIMIVGSKPMPEAQKVLNQSPIQVSIWATYAC